MSTLSDDALKMALEQAIYKHDIRMKRDIILWGLMKRKNDTFVADDQIDELASFSLEEILENVLNGVNEN